MVSMAPPRVRVPIAEKYINQRTQSFTRVHAGPMQEWIDSGRSEDDYWDEFKRRVDASEARYRRDLATIEGDANMTFMEKRKARERLSRVWPAWTQEQEDGFIATYGDPRTLDSGSLQSLLADLQDTHWQNALRGGVMTTAPKHEWERKFYDALVAPRDGSVPVVLAPRAAPAPVLVGREAQGDLPKMVDDPEIQKMAEDYIKNVCPHCKKHFGKLNKNHFTKCPALKGE